MKFEVLIRQNIPKYIQDDWQQRREAYTMMIDEFIKLRMDNQLSISKVIKYQSEEYYKILKTVDKKFDLDFSIFVTLTKKEMDKQKAFMLFPRSVIALKNDLSYNGKDYPIKEKCFNTKYNICYYEEGAVMGKVAWKDNYFKVSEYGHIVLSCSCDTKKLIEKEGLTNFNFGKIFNHKKEEEPFLCITPKGQLPMYAIFDKLSKEYYREDYDCRYIKHEGVLLYDRNSLDNITDINFTKEATGCKSGEIIVSQKFRQFYLKNNLKGLAFKPILEIGTEEYELYNKFIKNLASELRTYNENHTIGIFNNVRVSKLENGIL